MGHVRDLPKSKLGVDIEENFTPKYITIRGKGELINKLKKAAKKADKVYLATDPDREGEAISWHLANILKISEDETCRIVFNEITKGAVKESIKEARKINLNLVDLYRSELRIRSSRWSSRHPIPDALHRRSRTGWSWSSQKYKKQIS